MIAYTGKLSNVRTLVGTVGGLDVVVELRSYVSGHAVLIESVAGGDPAPLTPFQAGALAQLLAYGAEAADNTGPLSGTQIEMLRDNPSYHR